VQRWGSFDLFAHIGTLPADGRVPELWVYRFTGSSRKGWPPLALDEHGGAWRPVRHRGRRRGFRWKPMDDRSAAHHCGVASWDFDRAHRELERRDRWGDDDLGSGLARYVGPPAAEMIGSVMVCEQPSTRQDGW
jgi:hypothetical protein